MANYEYKVVPAPSKGLKARGVRTVEGRFANAVQCVLNAQGADGWEYLRAELLPSDERTGLASSTTNWRNVLVFRRLADQPLQSRPVQPPEIVREPGIAPQPANGAERMLKDDGVEEISPVSGMTTALKSRAEQRAGLSQDDAPAADEDTPTKP
jgi:uncharacterized protein DUF4177